MKRQEIIRKYAREKGNEEKLKIGEGMNQYFYFVIKIFIFFRKMNWTRIKNKRKKMILLV